FFIIAVQTPGSGNSILLAVGTPSTGSGNLYCQTSHFNSIPTPEGSKVVKSIKVIALGMFRINPFKPFWEEKHVLKKVRASVRTNPITVLQPPVITKKVINSDSNGLSFTRVDNTKTRRPQPRSNTKNDRVPSASKSSHNKNKEVEVEEHNRKLPLSRNKKHMSSECVNNDKVISLGMFRISPNTISRESKKVPNTVSASSRTKPITDSQPNVITKKNLNSNLNGLSSTGLDNTKTRRPQPRSNTKNDRVPSASKSSRSKNKDVKVEEYHMNLLLSKKNKHISLACNNSKIDSQDVISKVVCVVCKKCLNYVNHDVCLNNYVNDKKSRSGKHKANVSKNKTQKKYQPKVSKPKNVGTCKSLATPKPRKPRFLLRWSPTGKMFDQDGKLVAPSNSESHVDCSNGDNACTSNAIEPKIKRFPNSTSLLGRLSRFVCGASTQVVPST
nr:hypothetical protein [Tanacetum cinerariifolium]